MIRTLRWYCLDVGHGHSSVLALPEPGRGVVVDSAQGPTTLACLDQCQIDDLRLVLVTHSDADHLRGIAEVLRGFPGRITTVAFNLDRRLSGQRTRQAFALLLEACDRRGILPQAAYKGNTTVQRVLGESGVSGSILYPEYREVALAALHDQPNRAAAVLLVEYAGRRLLLGSDVDRLGWSLLRDRGADLPADVALWPHHGADFPNFPRAYLTPHTHRRQAYLTMPELIDWVDPQVVLLSVGTTNPYGHPRPGTLASLRAPRAGGQHRRIICTQLTARCDARPYLRRVRALALLPDECSQGLSSTQVTHCPCGGTIIVSIRADGYLEVLPEPFTHGSSPGCCGLTLIAQQPY